MTPLFDLLDDPDAMHWAEAFCALVRTNPEIATDEGAMACWFSGAMAAAVSNTPEAIEVRRRAIQAAQVAEVARQDAEEKIMVDGVLMRKPKRYRVLSDRGSTNY